MAAGNTKSKAGGSTTREAPISWRPSPEARAALARLSARIDRTRNELLNEIVIAADRGPQIVADNDRGSAAVARARLHAGGVDHDKIAAFQRKAGMTVYDAKRRPRK